MYTHVGWLHFHLISQSDNIIDKDKLFILLNLQIIAIKEKNGVKMKMNHKNTKNRIQCQKIKILPLISHEHKECEKRTRLFSSTFNSCKHDQTPNVYDG